LKTFREDTYERLIALLDQHEVQYRLIEHAPEGRTELVSAMRGNTLSQAAKCIILMVKIALAKPRLGRVVGSQRA